MGDAFERKYETKYTGVKINLKTGQANFSEHAKELAEYTTRKMLGVDRRLAYNDLIADKRGIEMQRMINIGFADASKFLEKDPIKIMTHASRTLGADNTMRRVFGSADMAETFDKLGAEQIKAHDGIASLVDKKGQPISEAKKAQYSREVNAFYTNSRKDLEVLLERARGIRGVPADPEAMMTRMGEMALQLNSMRYLGGAMVASLADPARIVQRHGLLNTFKHGFIPFITSFKDLRLSQLEGRMAGTANDTVSHSRLHQLNDVFDNTARGTALERGVRFASTKVGLLSGLDQWTQAWKQVTAGVVNAQLLQSIAIVNGEKASAKELDKAVSYLAQRNIDGNVAKGIWKEVIDNGGGDKLNGVWLPNTDKWQSPDLQRAYRAALAGEIDHTIITPGMEKPNWIDSGMLGRVAGQFRSFSLSSTQKTVMAGLQEHDMAYLNGTMISLALGALSYYTYATAAGGETQAKMLKSIDDGNWRLWADEAISRSGQTAIFDSVQRASSHISGLSSYTTFNGGPITKQTGSGLFSDIVGPTGDLLKTGTAVVSGLRNPDRKQLHNMRTLMPYQNLFYFRQLLDQVENTAGDEFGLTGKRR